LLQLAALEDRIARQFQLFAYKGIAICRCGLQVDLVTIENEALAKQVAESVLKNLPSAELPKK